MFTGKIFINGYGKMKILMKKNRKSERGSALVYILIAIALLAALTVTFMEPSSQQTSSQSGFRTATAIQSQVDLIRSAIQECVLRYGRGDSDIPNGASETEEGANQIYPITPNSTYFPASYLTTAEIPTGEGRFVKHMRCPGNNPGGGSENEHARIWGNGKFMPTAPDLFEDWQYYNGNDGVFFWTRTTKSDSFLTAALQKLDDNYSECEADIIDATGGAVDLDNDSAVNCPAGNTCFRIWMITHMDDTEAAAVHTDHGGAVDCGNLP